MSNKQFDTLDAIAIQVAKGNGNVAAGLSTGERLYIALAANSFDMLDSDGYTITEAFVRLGSDWSDALITRWRHRGNPKNFA